MDTKTIAFMKPQHISRIIPGPSCQRALGHNTAPHSALNDTMYKVSWFTTYHSVFVFNLWHQPNIYAIYANYMLPYILTFSQEEFMF